MQTCQEGGDYRVGIVFGKKATLNSENRVSYISYIELVICLYLRILDDIQERNLAEFPVKRNVEDD